MAATKVEQTDVEAFAIEIQSMLEGRDLKGLSALLNDSAKDTLWAQSTFPVFDVLGPFLKGVGEGGEDLIAPPKFASTLDAILGHVGEKGKPKEVLLALLEAMEKMDDDGVAFSHLVPPTAKVLTKMGQQGGRRKKSFLLAMNTAFRHLQKLPHPCVENLEQLSELSLTDQGTNMTRTVSSTACMVELVAPFVPEMKNRLLAEKNKTSSSSSSSSNVFAHDDTEIQGLFKHVINLFEVPLCRCHLTLEKNSSEPDAELLKKIGIKARPEVTGESDLKEIVQRLLGFVAEFTPDFVKLLLLLDVEVSRVERVKKMREDGELDEGLDEVGEQPAETSALAAASLSHAVFHELVLTTHPSTATPLLPCVYTSRHRFLLVARFLPSMLLHEEELVVLKGMQTLDSITGCLDLHGFSKNALEHVALRRVLTAVTGHVLIKCPSKLIRKRAIQWVKTFNGKLDLSGRFFYLRGLYYSSSHSGFKGYIISHLLKPEVESALNEKQRFLLEKRDVDEASGFDHLFLGSGMNSWFRSIFSLPGGAETDLLEHQDVVMAALNLLRYCAIRDPVSQNWTGIWNLQKLVDTHFLQPFRKAIDLSRAHYQLEITQIRDGKRDAKGAPDICVDVDDKPASGRRFPNLPVDQEIHVMEVALQSFDMMDSVLCRVLELVPTGPATSKEKAD